MRNRNRIACVCGSVFVCLQVLINESDIKSGYGIGEFTVYCIYIKLHWYIRRYLYPQMNINIRRPVVVYVLWNVIYTRQTLTVVRKYANTPNSIRLCIWNDNPVNLFGFADNNPSLCGSSAGDVLMTSNLLTSTVTNRFQRPAEAKRWIINFHFTDEFCVPVWIIRPFQEDVGDTWRTKWDVTSASCHIFLTEQWQPRERNLFLYLNSYIRAHT